MPNETSPQPSTPRAGMIRDHVAKVTSANNYMVVTYVLVDGVLKMNRFTSNFPKGDFNRSLTLLQNNLTEELEKDQMKVKNDEPKPG